MIVLASDYVGFKVVEHLASRGVAPVLVGLDPGDRGGYNAKIAQAVRSTGADTALVETGDLAREDLLDRLARNRPTLGILAWWPRILKGRLLSLPERGWLNFHPSLLPYNRGKNPNFWCLVDETPCGVSLQFIDEGVDTGPVVARAAVPVSWEDTGETIYHRCRERILDLFKEHFDDIVSGKRVGEPQDLSKGSTHRFEEMNEASCIDLDRSYTARRLFNIIRARTFPPHPTAYFREGGRRYAVRIRIEAMENDVDG